MSPPPPRPLPLKEVRGPSALGGGARRFFDLLWLMALTDFKRTYFGTVLGYVWTLLRPLVFFGVLLFVFTKVFKAGAQEVAHYPVMLLLGVVLFTFFQEATTAGVTSVVNKEGIVRKTQFPRLVIPLATAITSGINLCLNLVVVLIFTLAFGITPAWSWLLFPFAVAALFVLTCAVSMMLSVLYVRFRDVSIIWVVLAQVLFYATPILYPVTAFGYGSRYERLLMLNPLAVIFEQIRVWVLGEPQVVTYGPENKPLPHAPTAVEAAGGVLHLLPALAIFIAICVFGIWIFNREAPRVAEDL